MAVRTNVAIVSLQTLYMPKFHYIYLAQNLLKTRFPTSFEQKKSRKPGLRQKKVANVSLPKFHYIYLAQNLLKTRFPTSFEQKKVGDLVSDLSATWSPTSRTTSRTTR